MIHILRKTTYKVTLVTLELLLSSPVLPCSVTSQLIRKKGLLDIVIQLEYCIIDALQICSAACHISAHFLCAFVEGEVSSFLEGDVIKEKLSNISNVIKTEGNKLQLPGRRAG